MWRSAYVVDSCMLTKPGSDLWRKRKNKQYTHALFENASASIGREARCSHLVYRNAELSNHPEHEALILSSLDGCLCCASACVVQSALMSTVFTLFCVCLRRRSEPYFTVTSNKMCKIFFVNWSYWKVGNVKGYGRFSNKAWTFN